MKKREVNGLMGILVVFVPIAQGKEYAEAIQAAKRQGVDPPFVNTRRLFETTLSALQNCGRTVKDLSMTQPEMIPATSTPRIDRKLAESPLFLRVSANPSKLGISTSVTTRSKH